MATQWVDYTLNSTERPRWLLRNGEILECPDLEASGSFRRIRIKDHPDIAGPMKNVKELLREGAQRIASRKQTRIWMMLGADAPMVDAKAEHLHLLEGDSKTGYGSTKARWVFAHPTLPIWALTTVELSSRGGRSKNCSVATNMSYPATDGRGNHRRTLNPSTSAPQDFTHDRSAVEAFYTRIQEIDDLDTVEIPDDNGSTITLQFKATNVTGELISELRDFLDAEGPLERARNAYSDLRKELRALGVVLPDLNQDKIMKALSGKEMDFRVRIDLTGESDHWVYLHLASGTISVTCPHELDHEKLAQAWQIARFEAEMKGELDAFLSFQSNLLAEAGTRNGQALVESRTNGT